MRVYLKSSRYEFYMEPDGAWVMNEYGRDGQCVDARLYVNDADPWAQPKSRVIYEESK